MIENKTIKKGAFIRKNVPVYSEVEKVGSKATREEAVTKMTVVISTGKEFDADLTARMNIVSAILGSEFMGQTETVWRLANNKEAVVTLDELKEVNAIALQTYGNIIGVTV